MSFQKVALVLDNGSDTLKAGFAKEEAPDVVFPTVVGQTAVASSRKTDGQTYLQCIPVHFGVCLSFYWFFGFIA